MIFTFAKITGMALSNIKEQQKKFLAPLTTDDFSHRNTKEDFNTNLY